MELFYITNNIDEAKIVDCLDINWVFIDLEYIGKKKRQSGRDTVLSNHSIYDIDTIKNVTQYSKILVRSNPIGHWSRSEFREINRRHQSIDMVMLPYFKSSHEVMNFIELLDTENIKPALLLETMSAVSELEEILDLYPFEYIHIGLNDLHIERLTNSMFEPYIDGLLCSITAKLRNRGQKFGIGGIGKIGDALYPEPERILIEQYRLNSSGIILSRSFKGKFELASRDTFEVNLSQAISDLRKHEKLVQQLNKAEMMRNYEIMKAQIGK